MGRFTITNGHFFQILFSFFSQTFISLGLTLLLIMVFGFLGLYGSVEYFVIMLIAVSLVNVFTVTVLIDLAEGVEINRT